MKIHLYVYISKYYIVFYSLKVELTNIKKTIDSLKIY